MPMQFDPSNKIIQYCMQGMALEAQNRMDEAGKYFLIAWEESENDFEKFVVAFHIARHENNPDESVKWMKIALENVIHMDDNYVKSALPSIYDHLGKCYEQMGDNEKAKEFKVRAKSTRILPTDKGPFYHGTKADLIIGDLIRVGQVSNYQKDLIMNHNYFSANLKGAGLAAALAKGTGKERVYIIEPLGMFENDPNVTDKKFPGNLTRSYRSMEPLKIIGEVTDWEKQSFLEINKWRENLEKNRGEIIN